MMNVKNMSYSKFIEYGTANDLHISNVNEFHKDIKLYIVKTKTNISVEYVQHYVNLLTYQKNIANCLGHIPTSKKDTEYILLDLIKSAKNCTFKQIANLNPKTLPKPTTQFTTKLVSNTDAVRSRGRPKFVFTEEDLGDSFSIREQLKQLPVHILKEMGKDLKNSDYTKAKVGMTWKLRQNLEKHPNIKDEILIIRQKYGKTKI